MNLNLDFSFLSGLSNEKITKGTEVIVKICDNVLNNPNNPKYQRLKLEPLRKRLPSQCFVDLLVQIGFSKSEDGETLIFDANHFNTKDVQQARNRLVSYISSQPNIRQLMNAGLTEQEARNAIQLSFETQSDVDDAAPNNVNASTDVSELMTIGYTEEEAINAINLSISCHNQHSSKHMDMDEAVKYLVQLGHTVGDSMDAFVASMYDIDVTAQHLSHLINVDVKISKPIEQEEQEQKQPCGVTFQVNAQNIKQMRDMGFDQDDAVCALEFCEGNVNMAIEAIVQGECYGSIQQCKHLVRLATIMRKYNSNIIINDDQYRLYIVNLLDDFNHLLGKHSSDDDFEYIYQQIDRLCDIRTCKPMKRHHRDRRSRSDELQIKQRSFCTEVMDKIHCHFMHCYDIGLRSRPSDNKRTLLYKEFANFPSLNKFNQLTVANAINLQSYSFGQQFYYWTAFKDCNVEDVCTPGSRYCEWYQTPKYKSLKDELINNRTACLTYVQCDFESDKASKYKQMRNCKTLTANLQKHMHPHQNTYLYDIPQHSSITVNHLLSVIVYCGYSFLSQEFSKTFRRLDIKEARSAPVIPNELSNLRHIDVNKESDSSLKQRNREFYHLSKYIIEAVNVFSKPSKDKEMISFYHGIDHEMLFDSMKGFMYQPLSTTRSREVAICLFTGQKGLVVEINCHPNSRYFDCAWISNYPGERELLFMACFSPIIFVNITDVTSTDCDLELFIKAICIIEWSTGEHLLSGENFEVYRNMVNEERKQGVYKLPSYDLALFGAKKIEPILKLLATQLIKHELHRYAPTKYDPYVGIHPFIDNLLHNIYYKKEHNGYLGYLFLKPLFFIEKPSMVNLDLLTTLHPRLKSIVMQDIPNFSTDFFNEILKHLSNGKSKQLRSMVIQMDRNHEIDILVSILNAYKAKFWQIGWDLRYSIPNSPLFPRSSQSFDMFNMKYFSPDRAYMSNPWYL